MNQNKKLSDIEAGFIVLAVVLLAYSAVLQYDFGALDDYRFVYNGMVGSRETLELLISAGRPLNGVFLDTGFRFAGALEGLFWLRLLTLIGLSMLGYAIYFFAKRHGFPGSTALVMGAGTVLLPPFQVYAAWAQHFTTPYAGLAAISSIYLLSVANLKNAQSLLVAASCSTFLLLAALLTYQPIAMLFAVGAAVAMLSPSREGEWGGRRLAVAALVYLVALALAYAAFKVGQLYYPKGGERYGLVQDFSGKFVWFWRESIVNATSFFWIPGRVSAAVVVCGILLLGFVVHSWRMVRGRSFFLGFSLAVCGIASYLPNLATAENWASYRSLVALAAMMFCLLCVFFFQPLMGKISSTRWSRVSPVPTLLATGVAVGVVLAFAVSAQRNVDTGLIRPNVVEVDNLAAVLLNAAKNGEVKKILAVQSSWQDSTAKPLAYDEFGLQSSMQSYYVVPLVDVVRSGLGVLLSAEVTLVPREEMPQIAHPDVLHVDFRQLVTAGRFRSSAGR